MAIPAEDLVPGTRENGWNFNKPVTVAKSTATTAGGAAALIIGSATTAPNIYFGSGAPTVSAPQGSIYLRTDGSSTSTRLYVNSDGGTTWTNVTTAA